VVPSRRHLQTPMISSLADPAHRFVGGLVCPPLYLIHLHLGFFRSPLTHSNIKSVFTVRYLSHIFFPRLISAQLILSPKVFTALKPDPWLPHLSRAPKIPRNRTPPSSTCSHQLFFNTGTYKREDTLTLFPIL